MGQRGPKPTPSAIKMTRGTYRADRAASNEAQAMGKPKLPSFLRGNKDATREFHRLAKQLGEMGLIGEVDANALARYSCNWVRWRNILQLIEKGGELFVFKDGEGKVKAIQPAAAASVERGLSEQLTKFEDRFGMNPSARSRIEVAPRAIIADPKDRFFSTPAMKIS